MDWKSTEKHPITKNPFGKLKKLMDDIPGQIQETRKALKKLKNERIPKS